MNIDLLRHGMPENGRMYRGNSINDPLSPLGWSQMKDSTRNLSWDFIATSPMSRCYDFASYLSKKTNTDLKIFENLKEIGLGEWEGKTYDEIGLKNINEFKNNPLEKKIRYAENLFDFRDRVITTLNEIISENIKYRKILIVSHAGVIRIIKSYYSKLPINEIFKLQVSNGELVRINILKS